MQPTQSTLQFHIPTAFMQRFNIADLTSELSTFFPSVEIDEKATHVLSQADFENLTELLELILSLRADCNFTPKANCDPFLDRFQSSLKEFSAYLKVEEPQLPQASDFVSEQLQAVIQICTNLADPKLASLEGLLHLSWAIGNIPKERKFSNDWCKVISEKHWLLLEDISRQVNIQSPSFPNIHIEETAKTLKSAFEILVSEPLKLPESPVNLPLLEQLFYPAFDNFVMERMKHHMSVLTTFLGQQDPTEWLKANRVHVKVLFRTIEVIGEAAKILSEKAKSQLPTLTISNSKNPLWSKLRNQLHHNKNRSWDIANIVPEKWSALLQQLFPKLAKEIEDFISQNHPPVNSEPDANDLKLLEDLSKLCGEDQYREVRKAWRTIQNDFAIIPIQLIRILFGFEPISENEFLQTWVLHAEPHLKPTIDKDQNQKKIFEILRIARSNLIEDKHIDKLMPLKGTVDKGSAIAELKRLLQSVNRDNAEVSKTAYKYLCHQFVFLKKEPNQPMVQRDVDKNMSLERLMSQRLTQLTDFSFSENALKPYFELITAYIELKHKRISNLIGALKTSLQEIHASWPQGQIDESNLQSLGIISKSNPKKDFVDNLRKLQKEKNYLTLPTVNTLDASLDELKSFPAGKIVQHFRPKKGPNSQSTTELVTETIDQKHSFENAFHEWNLILSQITCQKEDIKNRVNIQLQKAIELYENIIQTSRHEDLQTITSIFAELAFTDTTTLILELDRLNIPHNFDKDTLHLNALINKISLSLKSHLESDTNGKVDELVLGSENELSVRYVQQALAVNTMPISVTGTSIEASRNIVVLREIYYAGLDKEAVDYQTNVSAWKDIERKINCQRLSFEEFSEATNWIAYGPNLPSQQETKKILLEYLNGMRAFSLKDVPRFEHSHMKIEIFIDFLKNECFPFFPELENKEKDLISLFKKAYGLIETESKIESFSKLFENKIKSLGLIFSAIRDEENKPTSALRKDFLLLSAEYDLQDIGELAQLIAERPPLWNCGRHILSSQHLLWVALMRKMMAHYPLVLAPHIMRWNLEYLAFDTRNAFNNNRAYDSKIVQNAKRTAIHVSLIEEKAFDIENHLDRLSLHLNADVIYPSLHMSEQPYINPFGDLGLVVYPLNEDQPKEVFIHAVMELELILSHELGAKVSVIGAWKQELVNIPSEHYISKSYLQTAMDRKQKIQNWINSYKAYDLFLHKPWDYVFYRSEKVINRSDYTLYHDLVAFFEMLKVRSHDFKNFLQMPNLEEYIKACLTPHLVFTEYSKSRLFKWVCCLFERFSPPSATPNFPIEWPAAYRETERIAALIDINMNGFPFLPPELEEQECHMYYRNGLRLDILNGRSLLIPSQPVQESELSYIVDYAVSVFKAHADYILERLDPLNALNRSQFSEIKGIHVADPGLVEADTEVGEVTPEIDKLIDQEARGLESKITSHILRLCKRHGMLSMSHMLGLLSIEKEIALFMRDYYAKNRFRLKEPYLKMDHASKIFFNEYVIKNGDNAAHFAFVNSFQQFLNKINGESEASSKTTKANAEFSDHFKSLVLEPEARQSLRVLLQKRDEMMMNQLPIAFKIRHFNWDNDQIVNTINEIYLHLDKLFRMISRPQVFEVIKSNLEALNRWKLLAELKKDFEVQYTTPNVVRESPVASTEVKTICLFEADTYFAGKNKTAVAKETQETLMSLLESTSLIASFSQEWEDCFGTPLKPLYYQNIIAEAREALDHLLNTGYLPDHDFSEMPSYGDYWTFVANNTVTMTTRSMGSGLKESFKLFMLNGGSFQKLWNDPEKRIALESDPRLCKLIETYIAFFNLENALSNVTYYLKIQVNAYSQLQEEKLNAMFAQEESWQIDEYQRRLANIKFNIENSCLKLNRILDDITKTEFFRIMKLSLKRIRFLETKGIMPQDEELSILAIKQLGTDRLFDSPIIKEVLGTPKTHLKVYLEHPSTSGYYQ